MPARGPEGRRSTGSRHIANAAIADRVRSVCLGAGFPPPVICTPFELMT
jgi:hypothetical protein